MIDQVIILAQARLERLRTALQEYETAELGRLNATAEELHKAAAVCGWKRECGIPAWRWTAQFLAELGVE